MGFLLMLLRYFVWIFGLNIQRECLVYDKDKARDVKNAPSLLVNEDKDQDVDYVLVLVRVHGNHDPCLEPAM